MSQWVHRQHDITGSQRHGPGNRGARGRHIEACNSTCRGALLPARSQPLKIATFNINGVNRRLANLLAWLAEARPDIVCLQELKGAHSEFPAMAVQDAGYGVVWQGQRQWNGVAILARGAKPVLTRNSLPGDPT